MSDPHNGRIVSIDALRGLTMGMMILCASIASNSGLPAWMFHCQVPPPDHLFHPEVRGITWVDLVFPFFLFSMGAAIPLAMRKRLESGQSKGRIVVTLLKRWLTLVIFALVIGNGDNIYAWQGSDMVKGGFSLLVWVGMFLSLVRTGRKWVAPVGYVLVLGLMAVQKLVFHLPLDLHDNDIIIMILSTVSLFGGLIWLYTCNRIGWRTVIWLTAIALKALTSYVPAVVLPEIPGWLSWVFNWGFLQYLILILPASIVGDFLLSGTFRKQTCSFSAGKEGMAAAVALTATVIQLWGLYTRQVVADLSITLALAGLFILLNLRKEVRNRPVAFAGFALLVVGILFDFADGGIAKDYCNLSYLLTTGGMSALVTYFFLYLENHRWRGGFLARSGQNPMIAYTVCWFVICPLLYGCGLLGLIDRLCEGSVFWGVFRGLLVTALMYVVTVFFTKRKWYWRS